MDIDIPGLIFQLVSAYATGIFMMVGVGISFVGILLAYSDLFPSKADKVVNARIVGVRSEGGQVVGSGSTAHTSIMHYAVFEYVDANGVTQQAESGSGSSRLDNKVPGTRVKIRLNANKPGWATQVGNTGLIIGVVLVVMGLAFIFVPLHFAPITTVTWVVWAMVLVSSVLKFRKHILPKNLRQTKEQFWARITKEDTSERQSVRMMQTEEVSREIRQTAGQQRKMNAFSIVVGFGIMCLGGVGYNAQHEFIEAATRVAESPCPGMNVGEDDCYRNFLPIDALSILPPSVRPVMVGVYKSPRPDDSIPLIADYGPWTPAPFYGLMGLGILVMVSNIRARSRLT